MSPKNCELTTHIGRIVVIGEAIKRLSIEFREQHLEILWKRTAGMRDILARQYDKLTLDLLPETIRVSLSRMLEEIALLLP